MTEQQIKDAIRNFLKAWTSGKIKEVLSLFTDDSTWVTPQGTFKGPSQIEKYANWIYENNKEFKIVENGIGIIVFCRACFNHFRGNSGIGLIQDQSYQYRK